MLCLSLPRENPRRSWGGRAGLTVAGRRVHPAATVPAFWWNADTGGVAGSLSDAVAHEGELAVDGVLVGGRTLTPKVDRVAVHDVPDRPAGVKHRAGHTVDDHLDISSTARVGVLGAGDRVPVAVSNVEAARALGVDDRPRACDAALSPVVAGVGPAVDRDLDLVRLDVAARRRSRGGWTGAAPGAVSAAGPGPVRRSSRPEDRHRIVGRRPGFWSVSAARCRLRPTLVGSGFGELPGQGRGVCDCSGGVAGEAVREPQWSGRSTGRAQRVRSLAWPAHHALATEPGPRCLGAPWARRGSWAAGSGPVTVRVGE